MSVPSPRQCKAARALLGWTQRQLAAAAGVAAPTVATFESGSSVPMPQNLQAIRRALEEGGIEFIPINGGGPGVRLKDPPSD